MNQQKVCIGTLPVLVLATGSIAFAKTPKPKPAQTPKKQEAPAQRAFSLPAERLGLFKTQKWIKPGKAIGQGRELGGTVRELRIGDLDKSWVSEIKGNLKLESRSVHTRLKSEVQRYHLYLPFQPIPGHTFFYDYRRLEVQTNQFTRGGLIFGILPVKGKEWSFGDQFQLREDLKASVWYGAGSIRLRPPGRNKMSYSFQKIGLEKPFNKQIQASAVLQHSQTDFIGSQWALKGKFIWKHPKLSWLKAEIGGDYFHSGIPVHEDDLGPINSQLAFIYKTDPVDLGPRIAPIFEDSAGILWANIGVEHKF